MFIPPNKTEKEVVEALDRVSEILSKKFKFSYHEAEDVKQQAIIFGIEALERYDFTRSLEAFLYSHMRNRIINYIRDTFKRNDPPCKLCHTGKKHPDIDGFCERYYVWHKRNLIRQNIATPLDLFKIANETEKNTRLNADFRKEVEAEELVQLVDNQLPLEWRAVWLRLRAGENVPKAKRTELEAMIRRILGENLNYAS